MHIYEVRPRADKRGFDLISDALPFGRLWYGRGKDAIGYAKFYSRSHAMIVRVFDESGALIETHESDGAFREFQTGSRGAEATELLGEDFTAPAPGDTQSCRRFLIE